MKPTGETRKHGNVRMNIEEASSVAILRQKLAEVQLLLEVLAYINNLISKESKFEEFCNEVSVILQAKLHFKYIHIWIQDGKNKTQLKLVTPEKAFQFRSASVNDGLVGKAFRECKTQCASDVRTAPEYISRHSETKSEIAIPFILRGTAIGVLNIETDTCQTFAEYRELLEIIAENLTHSLRVASLYKVEEQFRETQQLLASITQHCQEAIISYNDHGNILSWNVGAERMLGYKEEEVLGKSIDIIIPEERIAAKETQTLISEVQSKGFIRNFETARLHKNGKTLFISLTISGIYNTKHEIIGFSSLYRDITAQKKFEREIQDRFEKMQDAYKEVGRQRRYIDYLMELVTMACTSGTTVKQVANYIVNAITVMTHVDAATIRLLDASSGKLILTAQSGVSEEWWNKKTIPFSGSLLEQAVAKGTPIKILDILSNPYYSAPSLARKNNLRSALIMPLIIREEVLGSITLYLSQEANLNLLDDEFIQIFGKQAAIALKLAA